MNCPYCGAELDYHDYYGNKDFIIYGIGKKSGDIYKCPNYERFSDLDEAQEYLDKTGQTLESIGVTSLEEVVCDSYMFNGNFYTDQRDNLYEGYPC